MHVRPTAAGGNTEASRPNVRGIALAVLCVLCAGTPAVSAQVAEPCPYTWEHILKMGSTGTDVLKLQQFLNASADTMIATAGPGSPSNETTRYGKLTGKAVATFQEKYADDILSPSGLARGSGIVGTLTRAKLNALCVVAASPFPSPHAATSQITNGITNGTSTPTVVATTTLETDQLAIAAPDQPVSSLAPAGAGVTFISVTLTAGSKDVQVKTMTIERTGFSRDAVFASLQVFDPQGLPIGKPFGLHADHKTTLNASYTIPAHASSTFTVVGNMASDLSSYGAQVSVLQIDAITASSPVVGALPLRSNPQTINSSLVVGGATATLSPFDPGGPSTHYIGDKNVRFSGIRIIANAQEDVSLAYMIWQQNGTASANDIANIVTYVNGTSTPATVQLDGKTYISIFNPLIVIPRGQTVDVYVQGDLSTSGARRTVKFDIDDNLDDEGTSGIMYGFGVGVSATGNTGVAGSNSAFITSDGTTGGTTGTPFFAGSPVTISGGAATSIQKY